MPIFRWCFHRTILLLIIGFCLISSIAKSFSAESFLHPSAVPHCRHDVHHQEHLVRQKTPPTRRKQFTFLSRSDSSSADFDSQQLEDMERGEITKIILSISREQNDETRRFKLGSLLEDKVTSASPMEAARFLYLWDKMLIDIGGMVQNQIRESYSLQSEGPNSENLDVPCGDIVSDTMSEPLSNSQNCDRNEKSDMELQLWALVDMMVQSKVFMKKAIENKD